jgi:hypothetical protein
MARQQSRQRRYPRPVPVEHLSARQSRCPGDARSSTRDTDADANTRTGETHAGAVANEFVKLNLKREAVSGNGGRFAELNREEIKRGILKNLERQAGYGRLANS